MQVQPQKGIPSTIPKISIDWWWSWNKHTDKKKKEKYKKYTLSFRFLSIANANNPTPAVPKIIIGTKQKNQAKFNRPPKITLLRNF